jgi:putative ABC transport system permease protein
VKFPIAFFPSFMIPAEAWLWGLSIGAGTALAGSLLPAWSARSVKVSEVFSKIA